MKLDHVKILLPDPNEASEFYQRVLGLREMDRREGYILLSSHPVEEEISAGEIWIGQGEQAELKTIALSVEDLDPWHQKAKENPSIARAEDSVIKFKPPHTHTIEICLPSDRVSVGESKAPFHIRKLGHVTLKDPNSKAVHDFYTELLGFRLSDQYEEHFFWMRCNEDHHAVAVQGGNTSGVHHIAFELNEWNDIKVMCDHFHKEGFQIEAGPGRHGPGNNIYTYAVDPFGIRWELFCELARIYDEDHYKPKVWRGERGSTSTNVWGPIPPDSFYFG